MLILILNAVRQDRGIVYFYYLREISGPVVLAPTVNWGSETSQRSWMMISFRCHCLIEPRTVYHAKQCIVLIDQSRCCSRMAYMQGVFQLGTAIRPMDMRRIITPPPLAIDPRHRYAISSLGDLYAWGRGRYGALGHDDGEQSHTLPTRLQGLKANTVNRIACGRWHCVALMSNDQLLTWGRNHCGQIGIGSVSRACTRPVLIELEPGGGRSPSVRDVASGIQLSE